MAKKWSKKEIEEYIGTKQISQENYVAPVVETNYVPREQRTIQSVANTVDTFNNVNNNLKQAQTTIEPITTEKKKQENNSFSFSIDDAKKKNEIPGVVQRVKEIDPENKMVSKYEKQDYIDYYNSLSEKQKAKENEKVAKELSNKHNKKYQESITKANKESTPILTESLNNQLERQKQLTFNPTMEDRFNLNENYNVSSEKNPYSRNYDKTVRENAVSKETKEELDKNRNDVILADYLKNYYEQENQDPSLLEKIVAPLTQVGTLITGPAKLLGYQTYKRADGLETYLPDKLDLNYQKTGEKIDNKIGKFVYDVGGEATKIASSELLNLLAPGVGSGLYWTSMYGNSYSGAKNNLTNQGKESNGSALLNAGIKTVFEYVTGKLLGSATKKLTGGTTSELEKALSNKAFNSKILQKLPENMRIKAANIFGSFGSEGAEEGIQEYLENLTDIITLGSDGKHDKVMDMLLDPDVFGDAMYSALVGGATGGTLSAVNRASVDTSNKMNQLNIFKNAIQEDLNNTTDATKKEKLQDILNNIDNSLKKPFSIENENIENIAQTMDENKVGQLSQNKPLEQVIREDLAQEEQQTQEQPIQTPLNTLNQGVLQENNQTPIQEQTPQITPLNQVNQELQETRQNDIADSVKAMNLEKQPEFKQKEGNHVYEKSDNSKIDTFRKDAATYLKAGEQTDNFVKTLEKIIEDKDIEIRFNPNLRDSQGRMVNGSYSNNVITLNPNSNRAGEFLAIHELTHAIGTKSMINMIQKYRKSNAEFDSAVKRLLTTYNATEINEEALGDIAGQLFGNQEYINNLSMENPSLFKRIYNEIKYLWHQFRGYKNQNQFIEDLRNKWESAYRNQKVQQTTKTGYSLEERVSGDKLLDTQDLINEIKDVGAEVDDNGYVTVYHQTTDENAQKIRETGQMISKEPSVFFSTSKNASQSDGRGTTKLEFKIPAEELELDDLFSDNADVKIRLNGKNSLDVSNYLIDNTQDMEYNKNDPEYIGLIAARPEIEKYTKYTMNKEFLNKPIKEIERISEAISRDSIKQRNKGKTQGNYYDIDSNSIYTYDIKNQNINYYLNNITHYTEEMESVYEEKLGKSNGTNEEIRNNRQSNLLVSDGKNQNSKTISTNDGLLNTNKEFNRGTSNEQSNRNIKELDNSSFSLQKKYDDIVKQRDKLKEESSKLYDERKKITDKISNYSMFKQYEDTTNIDKLLDENKQKSLELYEEQKQLEKQLEEVKQQEKQKKIDEVNKNVTPHKQKQYDILQKTNPMLDEYHTGIRQPGEIKTWNEAMQDAEQDGEGYSWGDFSKEDAEKTLKNNSIKIYSSYPIKNGVFVSTSFDQAKHYAGGDGSKVYSKTINPDEVAWINVDEGQYAKVDTKYSKENNEWASYVESSFKNKPLTQSDNGKKLSKKQEQFFKDTKVRDNNGNLITVYHTTTNAIPQFNEFNPVGTDYYKFGDQVVNYFTNDKNMSGSYADQDYVMADTSKISSMNEVNKLIEEHNNNLNPDEEFDYNVGIVKDGDGYKLKVTSQPGASNSGVTEEFYPRKYKNDIDLFKEIKNDLKNYRTIRDENGRALSNDKKIQYEGYVNITNPYVIDAEERNWNQVVSQSNDFIDELDERIPQDIKDNLTRLYQESANKSAEARDKYNGLHNVIDHMGFNGSVDENIKKVNEVIKKVGVNEIEEVLNDTPMGIMGVRGWYNLAEALESEELIGNSTAKLIIDDFKLPEQVKETLKKYYNKPIDRTSFYLDLTGFKKSFGEQKTATLKEIYNKDVENYNEFNKYRMPNSYFLESISSDSSNPIHTDMGYDLNDMFETRAETMGADTVGEEISQAASVGFSKPELIRLWGTSKTTNDVVKEIIASNKDGKTNYDGVIIKNVYDYGGKSDIEKTPNDLYVTFNSNQFKNVDNTNPTEDPDIRYSKDNKTWREYLEKEFPSQGTRTNLQDINERNKKLTEKEKTELDGLKALYETGLMEKTDEDYKRMQELERRNNIKETTKALNLEKEAPKKYSINENAKDDYVSMKVDKAIQKNAYKNLNVTTKAAENYLKFNREQKTNFKDSLLKFVGKTKEQLSNSKTHNQIKDLVNNYANVEYNYIDEELKSIKSEIRKTKINIPEELRKQITDYSDFRKQSKLNITKDGKDIDSIWQELSNDYPHIFDSSIQTEADMLYALSDLMNKDIKITEKYRIPDSDLDYAVTRIQNSLIDNALTQEELNNIEKDLQLKAERRTRQVVQQELLKKMDITLDDIESGKDIKALNYQITDPRRVNEKVFSPKVAQKINDATVNFVSEQEAKSNRWKNKERKEIKDLGIKARSKESAAVQKYGEKEWINDKGELLKYGDEQLAKEFPDIRTQEKIKNAAKVLREKYDNYIDMINTSIGEMGYDPIPKRKDYFRHFYEITDKFSQLGIPFNANDMSSDLLPTDINGLTDEFKPGKQWFASAQQRTGKKTVYDAITGIDGYLEGASNQIFHTESIQRYRTLSKLIRETYGQKALEDLNNLENLTEEARQKRIKEVYDNKLSGYAAWLDEQANAMAGKKGKIDRGVEEVAGRKIYSALNTLKKQVGSNMTGFNVRSAMTNFASVIQGASKTKKTAFLKGTLSTIQNIVHNDGLIEKSNFLTNRFGSDSLSKKMWQKVSNAGQMFMTGTDWFTANQIWRSKYFENMSKGMTEKQAIKNADDFASRIMGDRSKGQTASMFNSKTLGFLTQFQLEVNNQWQSIIHDNKMDIKTGNKSGATVLFQLGQLAAMSNLFNLMMKSLTGSDVMFDPIDILKGAINPDDDDKDKDLSERIREALGKIVDQLPMANVIKGTLFGNEGGRIPISEAFEGIKTTLGFAFHGKNKYNQDITWNDAKKDLLEALPYWIMPTGWGQLRKTIKGTEMYTGDKPVAGSYTDSGNLRFTADTSLAGKTKAALFGAYSSKEAQDYIKGGFKTITKGNNLDELKNLGYTSSQYKKYRQELNAAGRKNQEKIDYIMGLDIPKKEKDVMASRVLRKDVDTNDIKNFDTLTEFNKWYKKQYGSQKK